MLTANCAQHFDDRSVVLWAMPYLRGEYNIGTYKEFKSYFPLGRTEKKPSTLSSEVGVSVDARLAVQRAVGRIAGLAT